MNLFNIISLLILSLSLFSCSTEKIKNDLKDENLNGKVKSVTQREFVGIMKFGEFQKQRIEHMLVTKYDNSGKTVEEKNYNSAGKMYLTYIPKYDDKANLIEGKRYYADGSLSDRGTFKYDADGNRIEINFYYSNDSLGYKYIKKYDIKHRLIEQTLHMNGDLSITRYSYDSKESKVELNYNPDGSLRDKYVYKYDNIGNQIEKNIYNSNGNVSERTTYLYDNNGNKILVLNYRSTDGLSEKTTYSYKYDKIGNWIKKITFVRGNQTEYVERGIEYY